MYGYRGTSQQQYLSVPALQGGTAPGDLMAFADADHLLHSLGAGLQASPRTPPPPVRRRADLPLPQVHAHAPFRPAAAPQPVPQQRFSTWAQRPPPLVVPYGAPQQQPLYTYQHPAGQQLYAYHDSLEHQRWQQQRADQDSRDQQWLQLQRAHQLHLEAQERRAAIARQLHMEEQQLQNWQLRLQYRREQVAAQQQLLIQQELIARQASLQQGLPPPSQRPGVGPPPSAHQPRGVPPPTAPTPAYSSYVAAQAGPLQAPGRGLASTQRHQHITVPSSAPEGLARAAAAAIRQHVGREQPGTLDARPAQFAADRYASAHGGGGRDGRRTAPSSLPAGPPVGPSASRPADNGPPGLKRSLGRPTSQTGPPQKVAVPGDRGPLRTPAYARGEQGPAVNAVGSSGPIPAPPQGGDVGLRLSNSRPRDQVQSIRASTLQAPAAAGAERQQAASGTFAPGAGAAPAVALAVNAGSLAGVRTGEGHPEVPASQGTAAALSQGSELRLAAPQGHPTNVHNTGNQLAARPGLAQLGRTGAVNASAAAMPQRQSAPFSARTAAPSAAAAAAAATAAATEAGNAHADRRFSMRSEGGDVPYARGARSSAGGISQRHQTQPAGSDTAHARPATADAIAQRRAGLLAAAKAAAAAAGAGTGGDTRRGEERQPTDQQAAGPGCERQARDPSQAAVAAAEEAPTPSGRRRSTRQRRASHHPDFILHDLDSHDSDD